MHNFRQVSRIRKNLEKASDIIPRKRLARWKDRWMEGQTLLYRTLPATAGVPISGKYEIQWYGT